VAADRVWLVGFALGESAVARGGRAKLGDVPTYLFRILPAYICINSAQARRRFASRKQTHTRARAHVHMPTPADSHSYDLRGRRREPGARRVAPFAQPPSGRAISISPLVKIPLATSHRERASPEACAPQGGRNKNSRRVTRYRNIFGARARARGRTRIIARERLKYPGGGTCSVTDDPSRLRHPPSTRRRGTCTRGRKGGGRG